jgi:hypothetical protein
MQKSNSMCDNSSGMYCRILEQLIGRCTLIIDSPWLAATTRGFFLGKITVNLYMNLSGKLKFILEKLIDRYALITNYPVCLVITRAFKGRCLVGLLW